MRDGKVLRIEGFAEREDALRAAGLCAVTGLDPGRYSLERRRGAPGRRARLGPGGRGRLSAAAGPRVAGDEAHLVAQRRAAGRGGLRGDRPRPARVRRLRPCPGRASTTSRPTRATCTRSCTTCSATSAARPRAATSAASSSRTSGCASRASSRASACSTPILPLLPEEYAAAGLSPTTAREMRMAADYFRAPGRATPTRWRRSSTRRSKRRRYIAAVLRARASGPRRARSRAEDVDFMTEPFADGEQAARRASAYYETALGTRPALRGAALLRAQPRADAGALRPRRPRDPAATSRSAARSRSPSASARSSSRGPGTSSSGSGRTCSTARWSPSCATFSRRT